MSIQLETIINATGVVPAANQIERHPLLRQDALIAYAKEKNIHITAYSVCIPLLKSLSFYKTLANTIPPGVRQQHVQHSPPRDPPRDQSRRRAPHRKDRLDSDACSSSVRSPSPVLEHRLTWKQSGMVRSRRPQRDPQIRHTIAYRRELQGGRALSRGYQGYRGRWKTADPLQYSLYCE
jgi:hypothetical protein